MKKWLLGIAGSLAVALIIYGFASDKSNAITIDRLINNQQSIVEKMEGIVVSVAEKNGVVHKRISKVQDIVREETKEIKDEISDIKESTARIEGMMEILIKHKEIADK